MNRVVDRVAPAPAAGIFRWAVRVYYEDTDALGMVYHANYLKYLERARVEWLRAAGVSLPQLAEQESRGFVVRRLNIGYVKSARLGDELEATVRVDAVRGCSVELAQTVERDGEAYVTAQVQIAYVDTQKLRAAAMSEEIRGRLISNK